MIAILITIELPPGFSTGGVPTGSVAEGSGGGIGEGAGSTVGTTGGATGVSVGVTCGACEGSCVLMFSGSILNINCFATTMSSPVRKIKHKIYIELVICVASILILVLTSINITSYLGNKKVLGAETSNPGTKTSSDDTAFWQDFLTKNPDYIPGWVEIGNTAEAKKIDPNFNFIP